MPRRSKAIVGACIAAIALVALMAVPAFAATMPTVSLAVDHASQIYGNDVQITPTVVGTETIPGDSITLEAYDPNLGWQLYGEGIKVEDTGTVNPMIVSVDESLLPWYVLNKWQPVQIRATLKTISRGKDASGTALPGYTSPTSNVVGFSVSRVKTTKVTAAFPKKVKRNAKIWLHAAVTTPAYGVGIGTMRYVITGHGKSQVITAKTDETGDAAVVAKFAKRGTYKVFTTFWGNAFGAKSKTITTTISVR